MTDDLTRVFRSALDEQVTGLDHTFRPAADVAATVRQAVARRRRNRIAVAGAAVALAVVAGVGVQAGGLPVARTDPTQPVAPVESVVPDDDGPSALDTGVVRGNLAGDDRWLAQLRGRVVRVEGSDDFAEGAVPRSTDDVRVLYAADVDRWRTALVEVTGRPTAWGGARRHVWLAGPRGAAADDLKQNMSSGTSPEASTWLRGADGVSQPDGPAGRVAYVVVSAGRPAPEVVQSPAISPRGTLEWRVRTLEPVAPGVYEDVVDLGWGSYWVPVPFGPPWWVQPSIVGPVASPSLAQGVGPPVHSATSRPAVAGSRDAAAAWVAQGFAQIRSDYGVDVANLPRRLLWTGRVRDRDVTVLAVTLPDGAVITALLEGGIEGGVVGTAVLPAGPLGGLMLATSNTGDDVTYVEVLVPRGTTRLRLEDGGRITTVPVGRAPGLVSVRYDFSTSGDGTDVRVTALAADGASIATAGVNVGLVSGSGLRPPDPT